MAVLRTLRRPRPLNSISAALAPRCNHHSPAAAANVASDSTPKTQPSQTESPIDPRWLTLIKRRIGKCLMFGLKPPQVLEAGRILQRIARDWRELVAGSQGFLTQETRRGVFRQNVAWGDMDSMLWRDGLTETGHVNNVTYVRYAESARVNLMRNYATYIDPAHRTEWTNLVGPSGIGLILQSIKVDYKFPMTWPDQVTVYLRLTQNPAETLKRSMFEQEVLILSEAKQRPAARCLEQTVLYDYRQQRRCTEPPAFLAEQFQKTWEFQEAAKREWRQRIAEIDAAVRRLELDSWDRPDAVEDLGSARR